MFEIELRFCLTIAALLVHVGFHRVATEMPHHCGGTKPNLIALVLQPPAEIYIITSSVKDWVKPIDLF
jgi:hypothetical protein